MTPARSRRPSPAADAPNPPRGRVVVVGLGPAGPDLVTAATTALIERIPHRYLRTDRHPAAAVVGNATTFDEVYERADSFDDVYASIVEALVLGASEHGEVLYAVPGSPVVAERTVELLRDDPRVDVEVHAALSFVELAWARLGVDPVAVGARVIDGRRFAVEAAGERGPILVAQCDNRIVLSEVKLAVGDPVPDRVIVLQRLGLADESVREVQWDALDRDVEPDHLTSLWIPELAAPVASELVRFAELVRTLRERCPWDREQTHQTLTRHLLEETYEVLEAIDALHLDGDDAGPDDTAGFDHLEEELGDLLFQVVFHATLAAEEGHFTLADVARGVHDKLVHRHPHVFGDVDATTPSGREAITPGEVMRNWEQIKQEEKGRSSLMEGIPGGLPSLLYAHKVQRKAASVGFDWDRAADVYPKVLEELDEVRATDSEAAPASRRDDEVGDLLFSVVNLARHLQVDPESALRGATAKFRRRFEAVEALATARALDLHALDLAALDALWDEVKATEA